MSDQLDLQAVLQNGYFKTSRAKPAQHSPPPLDFVLVDDSSRTEQERALALADPRPPRTRPPPPPTCEDEAEALAKEFGSLCTDTSADEPPSRGDFEQHPILLEVHEHNPERRFVLVPDSPEPSAPAESQNKDEGSDTERRRKIQSDSEQPRYPHVDRKYEPVFEEKLTAEPRPANPRRRSRQDLPALDTAYRKERTKSAVGPRPEAFSARPGVSHKEDLLTPDSVRNGSSRSDRVYYETASSTTGPRRMAHQKSFTNLTDDRRRDRPQRRESLSPARGMRSESNPDPRKSRRKVSVDRSEPRYRDEPLGARGSRRESQLPPRRPEEPTPVSASSQRPRGPRPRQEGSRSSDEKEASSARTSTRPRRKSTSVHQDSEPRHVSEKERARWVDDRSRSRDLSATTQTTPIVGAREPSMHPRASATFPIAGDFHRSYPDDLASGRPPRVPPHASQPAPSTSTPAVPLPASVPMESSFHSTASGTQGSANSNMWPPQAFDPDRDGLPTDRQPVSKDIGSYRRYSEGHALDGVPQFPECPHLNVCPDCYQAVFANTEFRTQFQPMLRPTDRPLACDFGSSPWYRIAYLLTLKNEHPDLRLLHQVDNVAAASRNQPCPGSRKAHRNWFTVRDPYKRRTVPNFTVCYQCAKMVEVLLPNLMGTLVPDARPEPPPSVCALHFKPQRRRFALYFDIFETTADRAVRNNEPPDVSALASKIERLSAVEECREDTPIPNAYWHTMQYLPELTVCSDCFNEVVRPRISTDLLARNFYKDPQRLQLATCQLYSERMREIFSKACRRNDSKYLRAKVIERMQVEMDIHAQLVKLDRGGHDDAYTEEQVARLISEWKTWE
ncbi:uncharacterized protein J7T54_002122 [Emericellopsis cladophorae]|uniref:Uncharacterized protein n=1 Tax=Emericellopsis cladophorae TaxID=2686198 RepID=A0A9Q0BEZ8_9HYPO|nr:uncharacterized protein J7T54_002122 [Emericellopsis cladophorae]KAI6782962.1 hypothetical protein J7T54_002122 [Emericellopsis cladophorae]